MRDTRLDDRGVVVPCTGCGRANRIAFARLGAQGRCGSCGTPLQPPALPLEVPDAARFATLVRESALPVLVDFWAGWCAPCRLVAPEVVKVAHRRRGALLVAKVDTEALPDLAARHRVHSLPTLALFEGGLEQRRLAGARPRAAIEAWLDGARA